MLLALGAIVKDPGGHRWTVSAVMNGGAHGERYYLLFSPRDGIYFVPATEAEALTVMKRRETE
jgi:hypothetical protein